MAGSPNAHRHIDRLGIPPALCETRMMSCLRPSALLPITLLGACSFPAADNGEAAAHCTEDRHCDYRCSRLGECLSPDEEMSVRVYWSVGGERPSADNGVCTGIGELRLAFEPESAREDEASYGPVPCSLGQIFYDRMPDRFVRVRLTALSEGGGVFAEASAPVEGPEAEATLDLRP